MSRRSAAALILCAALAALARAQYLLPDDRAYRDLEALQVRGHLVVLATTNKPYTRAQVAAGLVRLAARRESLSPYERQLLDRLLLAFAANLPDSLVPRGTRRERWVCADVNPRLVGQYHPMRVEEPRAHRLPAVVLTLGDTLVPRGPVRAINTVDLAVRVAPRLSVGQRLELDTDGTGDNNYSGRLTTYRAGATGEVSVAYVLYEPPWGAVAFGRQPLVWGPGREGDLMLSENAPAPVSLMARADVGWLHFTGFTGELESEWAGTPPQVARRFVAGHHLVLAPAPWVELGVAETVVYGGPDRGISLKWSNPLVWYYPEEANARPADENLFAAADVVLRPVRGAETYVSFLADDIALDRKSPDRIAWTVGLRLEAPFGWDRAGFGAEYTRLTRWIYNYANNVAYERYSNRRAVLGHFLGPDDDAVFADAHWEGPQGVRLTLLGTHRRLGETRFTSRFPVDVPGTNFGHRHEKFPSGIVETTTSGELMVAAPPVHGAWLTVGLVARALENADNKVAPRRWDLGARVDLDWHIPVRF